MKKMFDSGRRLRRNALPFSLALFIGVPTLLSLGVCRADEGHAHAPAAPSSPATPSSLVGQAAPAFTLADVDGKSRSPADFRGGPVALYVFCGCRPCHKVARAWSQIQRSGTLAQIAPVPTAAPPAGKPSPAVSGASGAGPVPTLVLFHGDAQETRDFVEETQLELKNLVLLSDADEKVSATFKVEQCPRVFVLDAQGVIRYTNDEEGSESYKIPAPLIVSRTVDALRRAAAPPAAKPTPNKPKATSAPAKSPKSDKNGKPSKEKK